MPANSTVGNYERKVDRYYQERRSEMQSFVPKDAKMLLDVGCSEGYFGQDVKARQSCEIWGVEMMPKAAAVAAQHLDRVITLPFGEELRLPENHFDCIIFNDCLEHMEDPEPALQYTRRLLKPGGRVIASIPNMRYFPVAWDLLVRGEWEYKEFGVMDRTHLRFFTRTSIRKMFERVGLVVERLEGINPRVSGTWRKFRLLNTVLLGRISDMEFQQIAISARLP